MNKKWSENVNEDDIESGNEILVTDDKEGETGEKVKEKMMKD